MTLALLDNTKLPAYIQKKGAELAKKNKALSGALPASEFPPQISFAGGKSFSVRQGEKKTRIKDENGAARKTIKVVIAIWPGLDDDDAVVKPMKRWFEGKFDPKNPTPPDCHSMDGIRPAVAARQKQSKLCATCPKNAFGSADNGKGKACADYMRIVVVPYNEQEDGLDENIEGFVLDVPTMSMKKLKNYIDDLDEYGVPLQSAITQIKLDEETNYPLLHFDFAGLLAEADFDRVIVLAKDNSLKRVFEVESEDELADEDTPVSQPVSDDNNVDDTDDTNTDSDDTQSHSGEDTEEEEVQETDDAEERPLTPEDIDNMKKADIMALIESQEIGEDLEDEYDLDLSGKVKVSDLRKAVKSWYWGDTDEAQEEDEGIAVDSDVPIPGSDDEQEEEESDGEDSDVNVTDELEAEAEDLMKNW